MALEKIMVLFRCKAESKLDGVDIFFLWKMVEEKEKNREREKRGGKRS